MIRLAHCAATVLLPSVFGFALSLSFAPAYAWWFAIFCLACLFLLLDKRGPGGAAVVGFLFGAGWFGGGMWWIFTGLLRFTEAGAPFALGLTMLLVAYLSLFPALAAALIAWLAPRRGAGALVVAAAWMLSEWLRGVAFGGLPWLASGYAQTSGPLAGFAPIVGVCGLAFLSAWLAALAADCVRSPARLKPAAVAMLIMVSGYGLHSVEWTAATGNSLRLRVIQGNQPQQEKFTVEGFRSAAATYLDLAAGGGADLTVLPETAFALEWGSMPPPVRRAFHELARRQGSAILLGTPISAPGPATQMSNSAILIGPGKGDGPAYRYDKVHLLPFGEFFPPGTDWIGAALQMPLASFTPGAASQAPLSLASGKVDVSICYENLFDVEMARKAEAAHILLNLSNFAWFNDSRAPEQHLQVAQMRALETRRWFVTASNTGMTAAVDPHGVLLAGLEKNVRDTLEVRAELRSGKTPFMTVGNVPLLALALGCLTWAWRRPR